MKGEECQTGSCRWYWLTMMCHLTLETRHKSWPTGPVSSLPHAANGSPYELETQVGVLGRDVKR